MSFRLAVLDDYQRVSHQVADWTLLQDRVSVDRFHHFIADPEAVVEELQPYDGVVAMRERTALPAHVINRLPNLKLIVTTGMRNAAIDIEAATSAGVTVCGTRSISSSTVELTWGLVLASLRHIPTESSNMRRGGWQTTLGEGLAGRTLGVVGLGRIGSAVARVGRAFDMNILAWSQHLTRDRADAEGARLVSLDELLIRSDVVTLHMVLSPRTHSLIGARELSLMKNSSLLVNTSRGGLVHTSALLEALEKGVIGAAAVDVFDEEPLPVEHPLRSAERVVLTPHLGYVSRPVYEVFYGDTIEDVAAFLDGSPVRVLNPT